MHRRPFAARTVWRSEDLLCALRDHHARADAQPLALLPLAASADEQELITATLLLEHEGLAILSPLLIDAITPEHVIELTHAGRALIERDRANIQESGSTIAREFAELAFILGGPRGPRWTGLSALLRASAVVLETLSEHPRGATREVLSERTSVERSVCDKALALLKLEGLVDWSGTSTLCWTLTDRGRDVVGAAARDHKPIEVRA